MNCLRLAKEQGCDPRDFHSLKDHPAFESEENAEPCTGARALILQDEGQSEIVLVVRHGGEGIRPVLRGCSLSWLRKMAAFSITFNVRGQHNLNRQFKCEIPEHIPTIALRR